MILKTERPAIMPNFTNINIFSPIYIFFGPYLSKRMARGIYWAAPAKKKILVKKPISVAFSENVCVNSGANIALVFRRKKDNK